MEAAAAGSVSAPSAELIERWEKEYSPSEWTKRFRTAGEVIEHHVKFVTEVSNRNRKELKCDLDVEYGSEDSEKFDIYGDNLPDDAPLFVYIHGGYWQMLSKKESAYCAKPLVERGFRVIILDYELCPKVTLAELVSQIKCAGEYILNYAEENRVRHVSIAGHSAGAHLIAAMLDRQFVATVGDEIRLVKHVYLISGVFKLDELRHTQSVNAKNLLGLNDANVRGLSPLEMDYGHLRGLSVQVHVSVAENDSAVFKQMAKDMHEHLERFGVQGSLHVLPELDHFDIVEKLAEKDYFITKAILDSFSEK
ncbi:kynurenine formamidase [Culex quinquefasciatus]|uniref:Kynurenine formamidase n=1 Tax=Culex quinquefasciatus TaxID=7176 RepID=B0W291_CULQU|nr:kynurenine formamidase [Culex quinquefasciatus]|eukprot:XP_001842790.1 kynurenine formamidase [Culex quinquefasciatus]